MLPLLLLACSADPAPPPFVVVNKTAPTFTVINKVPAPVALPTDPDKPAPAGYQWIKRGDAPWKLEPAPEVAAPVGKAFPVRGDGHQDRSHNCPQCGREQRTVSGFRGGQHSHTCPVDGTVWWH